MFQRNPARTLLLSSSPETEMKRNANPACTEHLEKSKNAICILCFLKVIWSLKDFTKPRLAQRATTINKLQRWFKFKQILRIVALNWQKMIRESPSRANYCAKGGAAVSQVWPTTVIQPDIFDTRIKVHPVLQIIQYSVIMINFFQFSFLLWIFVFRRTYFFDLDKSNCC